MRLTGPRAGVARLALMTALVLAVTGAACGNEPPGAEPTAGRGDLPDRAGSGVDRPGRGGPDGRAGTDRTTDAHAKNADCPSCTKDFALYDPGYEDDGVWEDEVTALVSMFDEFGWTYERIGSDEINAGGLGTGESRRFRGLVAPGGWAWWRNRFVTAAGESGIRAFVESGGNFVGFCAGAYWAADAVTFAEGDRDYQTYEYDLALWPGTTMGPLAWMPWNGGTNANLDAVAIDTSNPTMAAIGVPGEVRLFYAGGPWFVADPAPAGLEVWGRAVAPVGAATTDGTGEATIVRYGVGAGNVILFAYHPEMLIDSGADGVTLQSLYPERQIAWDTGGLSMDAVNLQSWNVAHAALQITADENATPLTELP
ncbi:MAG: hypothetical protein IT198_00730 [Acidimicrobiia bacterium]|nr:hypothetical protein [Acidimicrobiia bacterium]